MAKAERVGAEDRAEIEELLSLYCRVVDAKDYRQLKSVFTEDAEIEVFIQKKNFKGPDEFERFLDVTKPFSTDRMHFTSNLSIRGGEAVRGLAYWHSVMTYKGTPVMEGGWYAMTFRKSEEGWKMSSMKIYHKYRTALKSPSWGKVGYPGTDIVESPDALIFEHLRNWFYVAP